MAEDIRVRELGESESATPYLFLPLFKNASPTGVTVHVRTPGRPLQFAGALRQIAARIAPDAALSGVRTLEEQVETGLGPMRVAAQATAAVSLLGVARALAGIFASAAYRVTQQRKEIAIRIAIGAVGACMGLPAAVWGVSLLRSAVAGVGVAGPALLTAAMVALILAALVAAFAAANRIARVQPADVLRVQGESPSC